MLFVYSGFGLPSSERNDTMQASFGRFGVVATWRDLIHVHT